MPREGVYVVPISRSLRPRPCAQRWCTLVHDHSNGHGAPTARSSEVFCAGELTPGRDARQPWQRQSAARGRGLLRPRVPPLRAIVSRQTPDAVQLTTVPTSARSSSRTGRAARPSASPSGARRPSSRRHAAKDALARSTRLTPYNVQMAMHPSQSPVRVRVYDSPRVARVCALFRSVKATRTARKSR